MGRGGLGLLGELLRLAALLDHHLARRVEGGVPGAGQV